MSNNRVKKKINKFLIVLIILTSISGIILGIVIENKRLEKEHIKTANYLMTKLFQDKKETIPNMDIDKKELNNIYQATVKIQNKKIKSSLQTKITTLYTFTNLKNDIYDCFNKDILLSDVDPATITIIASRIKKLPAQQQELLNNKLALATNQINKINNSKQLLKNLFEDDKLTIVKQDVTRDQKNKALEAMQQLPQKEIIIENQKYFDIVEQKVSEKEAEEKAKQEAIAKQQEISRQIAIAKAQAEAIKKQQETKAIQAAYVEISGINIINQKDNHVYNGCEAASLLMALKYKGYASNYTLASFADEMPKSNNPHQGFIYSIYDLAPTDVTHWIAPDALAAFGSKYASTTNVSGLTSDGIKDYINKGIPVIVYATYGFRAPTKWIGEVPLNLHVMLVTGYNKITGAYVINDPWANKIIIKKETFEKIYNLMHYAVVVD